MNAEQRRNALINEYRKVTKREPNVYALAAIDARVAREASAPASKPAVQKQAQKRPSAKKPAPKTWTPTVAMPPSYMDTARPTRDPVTGLPSYLESTERGAKGKTFDQRGKSTAPVKPRSNWKVFGPGGFPVDVNTGQPLRNALGDNAVNEAKAMAESAYRGERYISSQQARSGYVMGGPGGMPVPTNLTPEQKVKLDTLLSDPEEVANLQAHAANKGMLMLAPLAAAASPTLTGLGFGAMGVKGLYESSRAGTLLENPISTGMSGLMALGIIPTVGNVAGRIRGTADKLTSLLPQPEPAITPEPLAGKPYVAYESPTTGVRTHGEVINDIGPMVVVKSPTGKIELVAKSRVFDVAEQAATQLLPEPQVAPEVVKPEVVEPVVKPTRTPKTAKPVEQPVVEPGTAKVLPSTAAGTAATTPVPSPRKPWQMSREEFADTGATPTEVNAHESFVREALNMGEPVPTHILEGYKSKPWTKAELEYRARNPEYDVNIHNTPDYLRSPAVEPVAPAGEPVVRPVEVDTSAVAPAKAERPAATGKPNAPYSSGVQKILVEIKKGYHIPDGKKATLAKAGIVTPEQIETARKVALEHKDALERGWEYVPPSKPVKVEPPKGYEFGGNDVDGVPWMATQYWAMEGNPPTPARTHPDIKFLLDLLKPTEEIHPVFEHLVTGPLGTDRVVVMSNGSTVNPKYLEMVMSKHPNARWYDTEDGTAVLAVTDGKVVGVVSKMGADYTRSNNPYIGESIEKVLRSEPPAPAPADPAPVVKKPRAPRKPKTVVEESAVEEPVVTPPAPVAPAGEPVVRPVEVDTSAVAPSKVERPAATVTQLPNVGDQVRMREGGPVYTVSNVTNTKRKSSFTLKDAQGREQTVPPTTPWIKVETGYATRPTAPYSQQVRRILNNYHSFKPPTHGNMRMTAKQAEVLRKAGITTDEHMSAARQAIEEYDKALREGFAYDPPKGKHGVSPVPGTPANYLGSATPDSYFGGEVNGRKWYGNRYMAVEGDAPAGYEVKPAPLGDIVPSKWGEPVRPVVSHVDKGELYTILSDGTVVDTRMLDALISHTQGATLHIADVKTGKAIVAVKGKKPVGILMTRGEPSVPEIEASINRIRKEASPTAPTPPVVEKPRAPRKPKTAPTTAEPASTGPAPATVKEPWQMTRKELEDWANKDAVAYENSDGLMGFKANSEADGLSIFNSEWHPQGHPDYPSSPIREVERPSGYDPLSVRSLKGDRPGTRQINETDDMMNVFHDPSYRGTHRGQIEQALAEGKPVPAEVLADYPDLAAQYAPKPTTTPKPAPKPEPAPAPTRATTETGTTGVLKEKRRNTATGKYETIIWDISDISAPYKDGANTSDGMWRVDFTRPAELGPNPFVISSRRFFSQKAAKAWIDEVTRTTTTPKAGDTAEVAPAVTKGKPAETGVTRDYIGEGYEPLGYLKQVVPGVPPVESLGSKGYPSHTVLSGVYSISGPYKLKGKPGYYVDIEAFNPLGRVIYPKRYTFKTAVEGIRFKEKIEGTLLTDGTRPPSAEFEGSTKGKITEYIPSVKPSSKGQGGTELHAGVNPVALVQRADNLDIPQGSFTVERPKANAPTRDYDLRDRFLQPIGIYDASGKPIQKGTYDRLGEITLPDGTVENVGTQVGKRIRSMEREISAGVLEADHKLERIERLVTSTVPKGKLSPLANRKATNAAFSDFIDIVEKPFDDPQRIAIKKSGSPIGEALKIHDEMTEGFRQYIIDSRKGMGIDTPSDWGITEQGYYRHLFMGDIRIFDGTKLVDTARTYAEAQGKAVEYLKKNPNAQITARGRNIVGGDPAVRVSTGKYFRLVDKLSGEVQLSMADIMADLRGIVGRKAAKQKFAGFLLERKGVGGYSRAYLDVMRMHAAQVFRTQELSKMNRAVTPMVEKLRSNGKPGLAAEVEAHINDLWGTPSKFELDFGEWVRNTPVLRNHVANPAMAFRGLARMLTGLQSNLKLRVSPRSALVNLVQPFSTLWPYISTKDMAAIYSDLFKLSTHKMLVEKGVVQGTGKLETAYITHGSRVGSALNPLGWFQKASEFNRGAGYLFGLREAKRLGLSEADAHALGLSWAEKVEFDNSTVNIQPVLRTPGARILGQFKSFMGKNLENVRDVVKPEGPITKGQKAARIAKWATAQIGVGGIKSLGKPMEWAGAYAIIQHLAKQLQSYGMEKEEAEKWADAVYYGAPSLIGQDLSASVMILEAPYGRTWLEKFGNFTFGPTVGTAIAVGEAIDAKNTDRALKGLTSAYKPYSVVKNAVQGKPQSIKAGQKEIPLTDYEAIMRALGFTPVKQSKYYDEQDLRREENKFENARVVDRPKIFESLPKEKQVQLRKDYFVGTTWKKRPK